MLGPPQFLEALVAAAAIAVELVSDRIAQIEILVIGLGRVERAGGGYLRDNRIFERFGFFQGCLGLLGELMLTFTVIEDRTSILVSDIAKLSVGDGRVDVVPEYVEKSFVADFVRVEDDLHRFRVAGTPVGDLFVGRIDLVAAGVSRGRRDDSG